MGLLDLLQYLALDALAVGLLVSMGLIAVGMRSLEGASPSALARASRWLVGTTASERLGPIDETELDALTPRMVRWIASQRLYMGIGVALGTAAAACITFASAGTLLTDDLSILPAIISLLALGAYAGLTSSAVMHPVPSSLAWGAARFQWQARLIGRAALIALPGLLITLLLFGVTLAAQLRWAAVRHDPLPFESLSRLRPWVLFISPVAFVFLATCQVVLALGVTTGVQDPGSRLQRIVGQQRRSAALLAIGMMSMTMGSVGLLQAGMLQMASLGLTEGVILVLFALGVGGVMWSASWCKWLNIGSQPGAPRRGIGQDLDSSRAT